MLLGVVLGKCSCGDTDHFHWTCLTLAFCCVFDSDSQMVAPQVQAVAETMKERLRVAKMDSDGQPQMAGKLRVQGLPTLILFDAQGGELDRIEGALMKDQMIQWIESKTGYLYPK